MTALIPRRHLLPFLVLALAPLAAGEPEAAAPLKVLMLTGGCCHDYDSQKEILSVGMSSRANLDFTVVHEGGDSRNHKIAMLADPDWAKGHDVVLHSVCFGALEDVAFVEGIAKPHHDGVPAVMLHCSAHSYRAAKTDAWREAVGITSFSHEKQRELTVKTVAGEHPIMKGFPENWETPSDELYKVDKEWPGLVPLATAYGKETEKDHTVIWVNTYGKGKIFGTTLGHGNETVSHPVFLDLLTRGLLWTTGKLNDDGTPAAGYGPASAED